MKPNAAGLADINIISRTSSGPVRYGPSLPCAKGAVAYFAGSGDYPGYWRAWKNLFASAEDAEAFLGCLPKCWIEKRIYRVSADETEK